MYVCLCANGRLHGIRPLHEVPFPIIKRPLGVGAFLRCVVDEHEFYGAQLRVM